MVFLRQSRSMNRACVSLRIQRSGRRAGYEASSAVQVNGFVLGDGLLDGEGHAEALDAVGEVDDGLLAGLDAVEKVPGLVEEEVVAVEVVDAEDVRFGLAEGVEADGEAGKIHDGAA